MHRARLNAGVLDALSDDEHTTSNGTPAQLSEPSTLKPPRLLGLLSDSESGVWTYWALTEQRHSHSRDRTLSELKVPRH